MHNARQELNCTAPESLRDFSVRDDCDDLLVNNIEVERVQQAWSIVACGDVSVREKGLVSLIALACDFGLYTFNRCKEHIPLSPRFRGSESDGDALDILQGQSWVSHTDHRLAFESNVWLDHSFIL